MNNNTIVRIQGSKKLFESLAKEIILEAEGKSHAQKMTEKMMKPGKGGGSKAKTTTGETVVKDKTTSSEGPKTDTPKKPAPKKKAPESEELDEAKNPEVDKLVKGLVSKLSGPKYFGHGDHLATIRALKAGLDRLEAQLKPKDSKEEAPKEEE